ncbi:MAG: DUF1939 domain-containing protein [Ignavibacteriaceae bacterium]|nr:DUF1939 domain-containing protein [Ignavibacteriaceae bacterium]
MKKTIFLFVILLQAIAFTQTTNPKSDVMLQGFYWNSPDGGIWYDSLASLAPRLASAGFGAIWFPSPVKGAGGGASMGYDPYDHYDFGEFYQKGSREIRFGSKGELEHSIKSFHDAGIKVYADAVLRHMMGGEEKIPYQCIPINNGNKIVPDSAYLLFNYPAGSGRFKKDASSFYPNAENCWVDPLFVQVDPIFRFGDWLDHNKKSVRDSLIAWGKYLRETMKFDGFRLDAVKSVDPGFMAAWLKGVGNYDYAVAELWSNNSDIGSWLNQVQNVNGAKVSMFDFPLRYTLKDLCNNTTGSFDVNTLYGAGLVNSGVSGFDVNTFLENHDFDRIGFDGSIDSGHDPVLTDKQLGYAYILFAEGRPTVFFKDYFDYGYSGKIDTLIWIRQNFLSGSTTKGSALNPWFIVENGNSSSDLYVARRDGGNGKPQVFLLINDSPTQWKGVWVNSNHPNETFKDFAGLADNQLAQPDGRVQLWAPPRGYAVFIPRTDTINYSPVIENIPDQVAYTNSKFVHQIGYSDLNDKSLTFSASGKPNWLTLDNSGKLSGTPTFADTGKSTIIISVTDPKGLFAVDTFKLSVVYNLPPKLEAIKDTTLKATTRFEYQAAASDQNKDSLYFFFAESPSWLNVNLQNGLLTGTPSVTDTGLYSVHLKVTDGRGAFDSTLFSIHVKENVDDSIATYGKPTIDGNVEVSVSDWLDKWLVVADSDTDSFWNGDSLDNELIGLYATWDSDSLYLGVDYILNDKYNTMILYINAGIAGGITNFNSKSGYVGDYQKNFRFTSEDSIDFFIADYYHTTPSLFKIIGKTAEDISKQTNGKRGNNGRGAELAISWNDIYGLGAGVIPHNVVLKIVGLIAGGLDYGAGDSAPNNDNINGDAGPDSLKNLATISPDLNGDGIPDPTIFIISDVKNEVSTPREFGLMQNYPNPFNPSTKIKFSVETRCGVSLRIYDVLGNEVATLVNEEKRPGSYEVSFDTQQTTNNRQLSSGVYFYQLRAGSFVQTKKMIVLK